MSLPSITNKQKIVGAQFSPNDASGNVVPMFNVEPTTDNGNISVQNFAASADNKVFTCDVIGVTPGTANVIITGQRAFGDATPVTQSFPVLVTLDPSIPGVAVTIVIVNPGTVTAQ